MGAWAFLPIFIILSVAAAIFAKPLGEFHQRQIDMWPKPLRSLQTLGVQYDDPVTVRCFQVGYIVIAVAGSALLLLHLTGH